ncbi:unnamed protein product, partial [marine sediment metagenome]
MDFSYIDDKEWLTLDQDTKDQVIDYAFNRDIASDPEYSALPEETKTDVLNVYNQQAEAYSTQTHA